VRAAWTLLELVRLVHALFVKRVVKAKAVVFFPCVSTLCLGNSATYVVWVTKFVESLIMGRLEVVVDHTTLLLLSKAEVTSFQLLGKTNVGIFLCLLVAIISLHLDVGILGLRDHFLVIIVTDCDVGTLKLRAHSKTIGRISTMLSLSINLRGIHRFRLAHAYVTGTKVELSFGHTGLHLGPALNLVSWDHEHSLILLVSGILRGRVVTEREMSFT